MEYVCHNGERKVVEPWSLFLHMKAKDFLCSNIDYDIILVSIKAMKPNDLRISINIKDDQNIGTTNMLLEILQAYDSQVTKNKRLLQFAINISDVLLSKEPESIINRLQAIKRQRTLSNDEIAQLVALRNKYKKKKVILCAVSIMLDESKSVKSLLDDMTEKERIQITDYPIYSLYKLQLC